MKSSLMTLALLAASVLANDAHAGGREPGSLLLYPVHRSGGGLFTVVSVTNTNTAPATVGSLGGSTNAHFYYTNVTQDPLDPFRPLGCAIFDRVEPLTPADTFSALTECHDLGIGFEQQGYLVVVAEDPSQVNVPWSHNDLIGSVLILSATGFAYSLEAIALRSPAPTGSPTDIDNDQDRDFDGVEYELLPDRLYLDSFLDAADPQLVLLNLTGDHMDLQTVQFSVWNDYEVPLSATLVFQCWFEAPLTRISPLFGAAFLAGVPNDPEELDTDCDGLDDIETGWAMIQSLGVRTPGGAVVATDGVLMGALTSGVHSICDPKRHLGESKTKQANGAVRH